MELGHFDKQSSLTQKKKGLAGKNLQFFLLETPINCTLNENLNPEMMTIRTLFPNFRKRAGRISPPKVALKVALKVAIFFIKEVQSLKFSNWIITYFILTNLPSKKEFVKNFSDETEQSCYLEMFLSIACIK